MDKIKKILEQGGYSCVIKNKYEIRTYSQRGVFDLFDLYTHEIDFMTGAYIADKIIGKAAATLMILGGIEKVYTKTISSHALNLFHEHGISVEFKKEVPFIVNRDLSDWCPMEKLCYQDKLLNTTFHKIEIFVSSLNAS